MEYRMKPGPIIEVVDGPFAGKRFEPGKVYDAVPEGEMSRFDQERSVTPEAPPSYVRKSKKTDVTETADPKTE